MQKQAGFVEERRLDTVRTVHFGGRTHVFEVSWDFAASGRCRFGSARNGEFAQSQYDDFAHPWGPDQACRDPHLERSQKAARAFPGHCVKSGANIYEDVGMALLRYPYSAVETYATTALVKQQTR